MGATTCRHAQETSAQVFITTRTKRPNTPLATAAAPTPAIVAPFRVVGSPLCSNLALLSAFSVAFV